MTYGQVERRAVGKVNHAIKSGRLTRQPCVDCGEAKAQAHHPRGYDGSAALDVEWVCRFHHLERHGKRPVPSWRKRVRIYMASTGRKYERGKTYTYSDWSGPQRLFDTIERAWNLLRTDEERAYAAALMERLSEKEAVA